MILLSEVKFYEVDGESPHAVLMDAAPDGLIPLMNSSNSAPPFIEIPVYQELIRGRRFIRPDGEVLYVGCSKEVQDIIGIHYDEWDKLEATSEANRDNYISVKHELEDIREAGFIKRLKWLIYGIKPRI